MVTLIIKTIKKISVTRICINNLLHRKNIVDTNLLLLLGMDVEAEFI